MPLMSKQWIGSDAGFTLVETLVSIVILAIASGLLLQSISLASSQISGAYRKQAAEMLGMRLLSERLVGAEAEGLDPDSGLYWKAQRDRHERLAEIGKLAGLELIRIEILPEKGAVPLLVLKSASLLDPVQ